jgi:hypothetical protein
MAVFVEDWQTQYASPYLVQGDEEGAAQTALTEDGAQLLSHAGKRSEVKHDRMAFVDGVRRGEAILYQHEPVTGKVAQGVAGSHACGAVIADGELRPFFTDEQVQRLVIWGSGLTGEIPPVKGGWQWLSRSIDDSSPEAPLAELQQRMRHREGLLAERLCAEGHLVIIDGPLSYVRSRDLPVVGYVKTHSRQLLSADNHIKIPRLRPGERTSLFRLGKDRYSCYLRLTLPTDISGPWAGIVRMEVPQSAGLRDAIDVVDRMAGILPRYAGVAYRDPRAPQNLQPVGALESHLRHLLGDRGLAYRAVREAVMALTAREVKA